MSVQSDAAASAGASADSRKPHQLGQPVLLRDAEVALWFVEPGAFEAPLGQNPGAQLLILRRGEIALGVDSPSLAEGDLLLLRGAHPSWLWARDHSHLLTLTVPEAVLNDVIDLPIDEPMTINGPTLLSRSVTAFLVELSSGAEEPLSAIDRYSLERFVQEMISALVLNRVQLTSPPKQRDLLTTARSAIAARCTDPLLDATAVAEDCNVSVRTLERVLAESGTSPRHEIRRARIEYAVSLLRNADYDPLGIDQIAAHAQFSNGSSLARAMRAEGYPPPPRQVRLQRRDNPEHR
ncbi:MAG: helix-turn-helix domain-containing protein [Acidipropionibacterium sp.]|jgi:AraC-like DNA-binding protein|nr:helix-turn-helix domain-containing protein [Acidipropionibacterium sp.]